MQDAIRPDLNETERMPVDCLRMLEGKLALFRYWPVDGSEYDRTRLRPTAQAVAFGKLSPGEGARKLVSNADGIFG